MTGTLPRQHFISVYFALEWQFDCLAFYISAQAISIAPVLIPCSAGGATAWLGQPAVRCNKLAAGDEGFGDACGGSDAGNKAKFIELAKAGKNRAGKGKNVHVGGLVFVCVEAYIF